MNIKSHFKYDPSIDVIAAHIGINKWDWVFVDGENEQAALQKMQENRFDVIPIIDKNGLFNEYFCTRNRNDYSALNRNKINLKEGIYYRTSLSDLIRIFKEEQRHFFFLTDFKQVLGLISYINLNCQAVQNYLFYILSDLEKSVSNLLKNQIEMDQIESILKSSSDLHVIEIIKKFEDDKLKNIDVDLFNYFYLQTVGIVLSKFLNDLDPPYKKLGKYTKKFSPDGLYTQVRNTIMHPVKLLLDNELSITKLDELLTDYHNIKEIISE